MLDDFGDDWRRHDLLLDIVPVPFPWDEEGVRLQLMESVLSCAQSLFRLCVSLTLHSS